jgi:nucleoside-diphosphate-sugar epimerase
MVPDRAKRLAKALAAAWPAPRKPNAWTLRKVSNRPRLTAELALLQQCQWKLPNAKAARILGYTPPVSFREGLRRSLAWLDFAGIGIS